MEFLQRLKYFVIISWLTALNPTKRHLVNSYIISVPSFLKRTFEFALLCKRLHNLFIVKMKN